MKHLPSKQILFVTSIISAFCILCLCLFTYHQDEKRFLNITSGLFLDEMTANTLNMHYTLAYPENFGIHDYKPVLPGYVRDSTGQGTATLEKTLEDLKKINSKALSPQDARLHKLLTRYLENTLTLNRFPLYGELLSPSSGMQSQLPVLLAEYTFRSERDVKDYLALLEQTDEYYASLLCYEQDKAAAGYLMPATFLQDVIEQCDTIVTLEELNAGTHFLQTSFQERLEFLCENHLLTEDKACNYIETNNRLLKTVLLPAYTALGDGLLLLKDTSVSSGGLATLPDGKEYYKALLISETGSYRPIGEIQQLLTTQFTSEYENLRTLLTENPEVCALYGAGTSPSFYLDDSALILSDLENHLEGAFPGIPGTPAEVKVKPVSENLEDYCAPAYYLTAPLDDTGKNVIYVNQKKTFEPLELYTTLAHEGYPGHLYQTVYCNRRSLSTGENPVRELLWYGGYLEGWALYVEFLSYDYASELLAARNQKTDSVLAKIEKHNRSMQLCLYSMLDIMIHYEGASYHQIAKVLEGFGINDSGNCKAIYNYIVQEPCNYLKYYLGYLEILELQKDARALWQDDYSDYSFHCFFLDNGPADFLTLSELLHSSIMDSR
ncbi:MAG: DUF885 domain-containing protein [Acetatifactor sp.]